METTLTLQAAADAELRAYHYDDAVRLYSDAIAKAGSAADAAPLYTGRAAAYLKLNLPTEALADAEHATELDPRSCQAWTRRGRALLQVHKYQAAAEALQQALRYATEADNRRKLEHWLEQATQGFKKRRVVPLEDELECSLCLKLFFEPVTLACGHTFCRACIARCLDHDDKCPLCREVFYIDALRHPVSITLKSILQKHYAQEYAARAHEVQEEEQHRDAILPLFLLDAVPFPGISFPMHIFEPRYRLMLRRVMASSKQFGLVGVQSDPNSPLGYSPCAVGCCLSVRSCNTLPDGRSIIDTIGKARFRIVDNWEQDGYLVGKVVWLNDVLPSSEAERQQLQRTLQQLVDRVRALYARFASSTACASLSRLLQRITEMPDMGTTVEQWVRLSYWLCDTLPVDLQTKQHLLEIDSCLERVQALQECLDSAGNPHGGACAIL